MTIETDDITSGRKNVDVHGHYEQLRGKWVNNFILAIKLTELIEDVRWCILLQVKF